MDHIKIKRSSLTSEPVTIIIPAYNEEENIATTLTALQALNPMEIIVVDDASSDDTGKIAGTLGAKVITHEQNKGKTGAILSGIKEAHSKWVLFLDADLGKSARYAENLLEGLEHHEVDMVVAMIPATGKGGLGLVRRFAQWSTYLMTGRWFIAPLSGQRLIKRKQFLETYTGDIGFGFEIGLTLDYCFNDLKILEHEAPFKHRELGKTFGGFLHRSKQGYAILRAIILRLKRLPFFYLGKLRGRVLR